jgi:hypothetical protein
MPVTPGMLLGMLKALEKRIKILEQRLPLKEEVRDNDGAVR